MDDIYRHQKREEFWSPTGLTNQQLAEMRAENEAKQQWIKNTAMASDRRPGLDGGNLPLSYPHFKDSYPFK